MLISRRIDARLVHHLNARAAEEDAPSPSRDVVPWGGSGTPVTSHAGQQKFVHTAHSGLCPRHRSLSLTEHLALLVLLSVRGFDLIQVALELLDGVDLLRLTELQLLAVTRAFTSSLAVLQLLSFKNFATPDIVPPDTAPRPLPPPDMCPSSSALSRSSFAHPPLLFCAPADVQPAPPLPFLTAHTELHTCTCSEQ